MKIAVMGAGGIGSYLGAMLARSGEAVTLVCRGAHLAAVRSRGLTLATPKETFTVRVAATDAPAEPADVVILAVKLYDLAAAARQMLPLVGPETMVVPIQNGVTAAEEVGAIAGAARVAGGTVFINCNLTAPGVATSRGEVSTFVFGELDGSLSPRVQRLRAACEKAGIDAQVPADIRVEQWKKFVPVAGLSAMSSLTRQPLGPVRDDPELRRLYRQAMQEVADLAAAKGVALPPDIAERMLALAGRYQYDARVSMLEDLEAGRRLELDWLSGYVSREAARLGVPAPFHDLAYACLKRYNR